MKLSTRTTYGLRAMMALAQQCDQGPVLLKDIAERQHLPTTYLEQIMVPLRKARLVSATRGIHGGYTLARAPETITLADIILVLEGPIELVECGAVASCILEPTHCALKSILDIGGQQLLTYFQGVSLSDLAAAQLARTANMPVQR
jgi:Rrf2 family cysteine metabolism transcriptional repressor